MDKIYMVIFLPFLDGFKKNSPSFKIAMSRRAGIRRRPRFTFWLTFFQSCTLPLFFSGLLSYVVGMKRRTSRCVICKRDNSHFVRYILISPDVPTPQVYFLVNLFKVLCYLYSSVDASYHHIIIGFLINV